MEKNIQEIQDNVTYILCTKHGQYDEMGKRITISDIIQNNQNRIVRIPAEISAYQTMAMLFDSGIKIQVCAPWIWNQRSVRSAINAARTLDLSPILGGWHSLTKQELDWYGLKYSVTLITESAGHSLENIEIEDNAFDLIQPIYEKLSFLSYIDRDALLRVMLIIVDPRWFSYPHCTATKIKRLFYAGVTTPKLLKSSQESVRLLTKVWKDPQATSDVKYNRTPKEIWEDPRAVMTRYWTKQIIKHNREGKADAKTNGKFIDFLFYNWLDVLHPHQSEKWFMPDSFFTDERELRAWKEHQK